MSSISLCMIIKDEEQFLEQCLNCVKGYVDEIIIVDTGSTDNSKNISKKFTNNIFEYEWKDDFASARNFSLSKATKDWILVLDADEVISRKDMKKIRKLIRDEADAFQFIQRNYTNDSTKAKWTALKEKSNYTKNYIGYTCNPIIRLFRNNRGIKYAGAVHEVVNQSVRDLNLKMQETDIVIHHYFMEKQKNSLEHRQLKYLEIAQKALKKKPDGRMYGTAASINLYFKKDYKKAIEYFELAIKHSYKVNESTEGLAECYIKLKNYKKAYSYYKKLAKSGYLTPTLCNNTANILVMYKHYRAALKFYALALKLGNPNKERILNNISTLKKIIK